MEKINDPSLSAAVSLEQSSFSQVMFCNVERFYLPGRDVTCHYIFNQQLIPRQKDWIGIFKVGWKMTREYYTFMWAALPRDLSKESTKHQVQFKAYYLPKDDEDYQFCYVDQDGVVRGASIPFQFRLECEEDIVVVSTKGKVEEMEQQNEQLLRENQKLKDSCAILQKQNSDVQAKLQRKQDENFDLSRKLSDNKVEYDALKREKERIEREKDEKLEAAQNITKKLELQVEEQKAHWETQLLQLKEDNQKMSSENKQMRLSIDQLRDQLSTSEKDMEELVLRDQDNREQLQHLKNQNSQLILSLTGQEEQQRKLELTVEKLKEKETTKMKKLQELMEPKSKDSTARAEELVREVDRLKAKVEAGRACYLEKYKECQRLHKQIRKLRAPAMDENFDLSRKLSDNKVEYDALKSEKERIEREKDEKLEAAQNITKKLELQVEEQKAHWETQLLQLKEDNQKMSSENKQMRLSINQLRTENFHLSSKLSGSQVEYDALKSEKERIEREKDRLKKEIMDLEGNSKPSQKALTSKPSDEGDSRPWSLPHDPYLAYLQEIVQISPGYRPIF